MSGISRHVVIAGAVASLLAVGGLLVRCGGPNSESGSETRHGGGRSASSGSARSIAAGPTEAAAIASATDYTSASQRWLYLTDEQIRTEVHLVTTPRAADGLADDVVEQVSKARTGLSDSSGRVWWVVRPLATKVSSYSHDQARVEVWTVTVLSAAEVAAPQAEWMTVQVDLEWLDGAWRVDGVRESPGPTPVPGPEDDPWDAGDFDKALDGFTRIGAEPAS